MSDILNVSEVRSGTWGQLWLDNEQVPQNDHHRSKKRLRDGNDQELGLLYYLFSAHHWGLHDLRSLWEGDTGWHDLILAMSSYEANQRRPAAPKEQKAQLVKKAQK